MKSSLMLSVVLLLLAIPVNAGEPAVDDTTAIRNTALDYIEGWYTGDGARMERSLHPELAKRIVITDPQTGRSRLDSMSAMTLVQRVRTGVGAKTPKEKQQKDITILERYHNVAIVKLVASEWVDFLQEAKFNGEWKIINVLWEVKPESDLAKKLK
ncbi:MAG TPA: nuclear transport factor 2 family protein [Thermoanaerobaculia bacterium]|nr:nuclear transport factor 2 family protein [Thermoanaerobaculia bacterium]